eukprot:Opistho-2@4959
MVRKNGREARLDGERLVEELAVKVFLDIVHKHDCFPTLVVLRSPRASHHLKHIRNRKVNVALLLSVEIFRAFNYDEVCRKVHTPRQRARCDQHLDFLVDKQLLHRPPVTLVQSGVVHANAKRQRELQIAVADARENRIQLLLGHLQKLPRRALRGAHCNEIESGETRLPAGRHKDKRWLVWRVCLDGLVCGLVHGRHPRAVVLSREAGYVHLERNGTHRGLEVVQAGARDAEPVAQVACICACSGQTDNAYALIRVRRNVVGAADNHLKHGATVVTKEMDLVDHNDGHRLDVFAVLPAATDSVPFFRRCDNQIGALNCTHVRRHVTGQLDDAFSQPSLKPLLPILHALPHEGLERRNVHGLATALRERAKDGKLRYECFAASGGRTEKDILVRVVERMEHLRLHGIEVSVRIERFVCSIVEGGYRKWIEVKKLRVRRVAVG